MSPFIIKLSPLFLTLLTSFGILLHDTRLSKAFEAVPSSGYVNTQVAIRGDDHVHTENITNFVQRESNSQPRLNTRFTDEKKYLTPRKVFLNTTFDGLT